MYIKMYKCMYIFNDVFIDVFIDCSPGRWGELPGIRSHCNVRRSSGESDRQVELKGSW